MRSDLVVFTVSNPENGAPVTMEQRGTSANQQWEKAPAGSSNITLKLNYQYSQKQPLALDVENNNALVVKPFNPTATSQQWILYERLTSVNTGLVACYSGLHEGVTLVNNDTTSQEQLFYETVRLICWERCVHLWVALYTVCFGNVQ